MLKEHYGDFRRKSAWRERVANGETMSKLSDTALRAVRVKFLTRLESNMAVLERIRALPAHERWTAAQRSEVFIIVHQLSGISAVFGFNELADIAEQLERCLLSVDTEQLPALEKRRELDDALVRLCAASQAIVQSG